MEYVPGARLLPRDSGRWVEELRTGLVMIHAAGVVQGDINWRNLVVGEGEGDKEWEERVGGEKGRLEGLLTRASRRGRGVVGN